MSKKLKVWETTREPNLLRNVASGRFYGRFRISGKAKWLNLDTDVFTVARLRIADERAKIERSRVGLQNVSSGVATMGELHAILSERIAAKGAAPATKKRAKDSADFLLKTWSGFSQLDPARVNRTAVLAWRDRLRRDGAGSMPPGAKKAVVRYSGRSSSTINKAIDALRGMLDIAVERGQLAGNPIQGKGLKFKPTPRKPTLPEPKMLNAIFAKLDGIKNNQGKFETADFCRFLSFTGCRLNEANAVTWGDVDFDRGVIRIRGTKTESSDREVPMIGECRSLLLRIKERRLEERRARFSGEPALEAKAKVLGVATAKESLTRACKELGADRLTHHDLRDAFATTCIEAGVDVPTVAAWLGHKDGGALLMKVYAHHRRPHSLTQAAKVSFEVENENSDAASKPAPPPRVLLRSGAAYS